MIVRAASTRRSRRSACRCSAGTPPYARARVGMTPILADAVARRPGRCHPRFWKVVLPERVDTDVGLLRSGLDGGARADVARRRADVRAAGAGDRGAPPPSLRRYGAAHQPPAVAVHPARPDRPTLRV